MRMVKDPQKEFVSMPFKKCTPFDLEIYEINMTPLQAFTDLYVSSI